MAGPPNEPAAPPIAPPAIGANVEQDASKGKSIRSLRFIAIYVKEYFTTFGVTDYTIMED